MAEPAGGFTSVVAIRNKRPAADDDHDGTSSCDRPSKRLRPDTPAELAAQQKREQSQWVLAVSESLPCALGKRRSADRDGDAEPLSGPPLKRILLNLNSKKHGEFPRIARSVVSRFARDVAARTAPAVASAVAPVVSPVVTREVPSRASRKAPSHASRKAPSRAGREASSRATSRAACKAASPLASRFAAFHKARVATFEAAIRERRDLLDVHEAAFREVRHRPAREVAFLERQARLAALQDRPRDAVFRASRDRLGVYEAFIHSDAFREASFSDFLLEDRFDRHTPDRGFYVIR